METRKFDLKAKGIDAEISSFVLRCTTGDDEFAALDLVTRLIPEGADSRKFSSALMDARVALAVVEVDGQKADPASFQARFQKMGDRARQIIFQCWKRMNALDPKEVDKLFDDAAP